MNTSKTQLEIVLSKAIIDFKKQYLNKLPKKVTYEIQRKDGLKKGNISRIDLIKKFEQLVHANNFSKNILSHIDCLDSYLAYSSSPLSFSQAWKFRKTKISRLSLYEVQDLVNKQAQLIPSLRKVNLLHFGEKGMIISPAHKSFLLGIRHSKGNYEDKLDDLGNFHYQPPIDILGMLRYRWLEFLTIKCNMPVFMFVTMWFKHLALESTNHVTMICPVKITSFNKKFDSPINLQLININESIERSMIIRSLNNLDFNTEIRSALRNEHVIKFNYANISSNSNIRNQLLNWAIEKNKRCPGTLCNSVEFKKLSNKSLIHLGHIIPQKWGGVFHYIQENNHIHHPDNLYLSCNVCNSSLNYRFPDPNLMNKILDGDFGTIGDFIRQDEVFFSTLGDD